MCGIAGILRFDGAAPSTEALFAMSRTLARRGPDDWGVERLGPCGLAHRRLSILDLSEAGRQPMSTADRRFWLSYNGEVYNYLELRAELEGHGHQFFTGTDSEVILAAFRAWGDDAFARFNGMWALAIWDAENRKLILSRDRMGVKPLYFHRDSHRILFASEAKALLAAEPALAELDLRTVARFLERPGFVFDHQTFFRGIERLDPANSLTVYANGRSRIARYWSFRPPVRTLDVTEREATAQVRDLLVDSVKLRFRSDVPVGTCLSGGLDSSSIVAIAGKCLGKTPQAFSSVYDGAEYDEKEFIRLMARDLSLEAYETSPDGSDLQEVIEDATYYQEQPTAAPGIYSQWHVMKLAAPRVRVLLDGQGGDEVFGGYFGYFPTYARALLDRGLTGDVGAWYELARAEREIAALSGISVTGELRRYARNKVRARTWAPIRGQVLDALRSARGRSRAIDQVIETVKRTRGEQPVSPSALIAAHLKPLLNAERGGWVPDRISGNALTDLMWDQLVRSSIPGLLHYEDRDSMAFSIEARVPFLDYRLIEYVFQLPMRLKIDRSNTKAILREAMRGILPEPIRLRRDKKGYPTPLALWLRQPRHHAWVEDLLLSRRAREREFTDPAAVERLWNEHRSGAHDHHARIYMLATLELFCRRFTDGPFAIEAPPPHAAREDEARLGETRLPA